MRVLEANPIYLDSALQFLQNSTDNFTNYIQYYYLKDDSKGLINYVMSNPLDSNKYSNTDMAMAYSRMGEVFASKTLSNEAEVYFKKSVKLMPYIIDYKIKYGSFLVNNNQIDIAEQIFSDALNLNPTIKQVHLNLGLIAILKGEFIIAESRLKQSLALDPDYILAYENLVLSAQIQNKNKDVKFYLNKILEIAPNHKARLILENL